MAAHRRYSLAHLTVLELPPPEAITVAAASGYDCAGLRLLPTIEGALAYPLATDPVLMRDTLTRLSDTGLEILDIEIVRLDPGLEPAALLPVFDVAARLGAKAVIVAGTDPDEGRMTASYAALCEVAAPYGLSAVLEFMPWTETQDLSRAARIVAGAAQPNGGVLVDPLHFHRSRSSVRELAKLPREWLRYAQICDGPAAIPSTMQAMIHNARNERWLPGDGAIDLGSLFAAMPNGIPISVEIPNGERAKALGDVEWARQALIKTKAFFAEYAPSPAGASAASGEDRLNDREP